MPVPYEFNQARVRSPMAPKTVLGHTSKRETFKFNLRHADTSAGNLRPSLCSGGLTPQPRAIFASELLPPEIPPELLLLSRGLTLPPQPIFAVGIGHRRIPRELHVVGRGNRGSEGYLRPN